MMELPENYEIVETVEHEYMILCNGFQMGGEVDRSGAGNLTFGSKDDALKWFHDHFDVFTFKK